MEEETRDSEEETKDSRRTALKKVGRAVAFVIPTIAIFQISALKVAASGTGNVDVSATFAN